MTDQRQADEAAAALLGRSYDKEESVKIRVLNNYVLVEPKEDKPPVGIALPDRVRDANLKKSPEGVVLAVGPGGILPNGKRVPPSVKEGDRVIVNVGKCQGFYDHGKFYVLCTEEAIMGVRE